MGQRGLQSYHHAWLSAHPGRDEAWLTERMADGFHIHHIDGDHANDVPANLVLIEGVDHMRLHGMKLLRPMVPRKGKRGPQKRWLSEEEAAAVQLVRLYGGVS